VADFQFVPVRIFKKNGVISKAVFQAEFRPFDIVSARFADYFGDFIHGCATRRPEGDATSIWPMIGFLGESKKVYGLIAVSFKQSPLFSALIDTKADSGQDLRVESLRVFAVLYPEINVIEKARAHYLILSRLGVDCPQATPAPEVRCN
jgi:hypothetical protein